MGEVEQAVAVAAVGEPGADELGDAVGEAAADQDHGTASGAAYDAVAGASSAVRASSMRFWAGGA